MTEPHFDPALDFDRHFALAVARRIVTRLAPGDHVLELGCAAGLMTAELVAVPGVTVTAVDRSASAIDAARGHGLQRTSFAVADVTTFDPADGPYAHVVAAHLVNELDDPVAFLRRAATWLAPGGLLHVAVANARSVHRLVALEMGLLDDLTTPSDGLARFSAGALLDADGLLALGTAAGLRCTHREPVLLKPLPNARMAELPDDLIRGLDAVAHHFPDHGGVNYMIFQP